MYIYETERFRRNSNLEASRPLDLTRLTKPAVLATIVELTDIRWNFFIV